MKIVLSTRKTTAPSTQLNLELLKNIEGDFQFNGSFINKDVILFMGYDPQIDLARKKNKTAIIGIVDPRPGSESDLRKADFFLANGVEMANYFSGSNAESFIYPIYPPLKHTENNESVSVDKNKLIVGYHGNKAHLELMIPTVCKALEEISKSYEIELRLIYNISQLGEWGWSPSTSKIKVRHIQWTESSYVRYLKDIHVGIVPNLIPFEPEISGVGQNLEDANLAHRHDLYYRFKPTTNMGRILVFAQLGVPVVSDMFPSSTEVIQHGYNGLIASTAESWFHFLKKIADDSEESTKMGMELKKTFENRYHWDIKNEQLISYFKKLLSLKSKQNRTIKERIKNLFQ